MKIDISNAHNIARLGGSLSYLNTGNGHAQILLLDGIKPAAGGALTNTLTIIALDKPAGAIANNALVLASSDIPLVLITGVATWARILNANGDWWLDCDVSKIDGTGAVKLVDTTLYAGGKAILSSAVLG